MRLGVRSFIHLVVALDPIGCESAAEDGVPKVRGFGGLAGPEHNQSAPRAEIQRHVFDTVNALDRALYVIRSSRSPHSFDEDNRVRIGLASRHTPMMTRMGRCTACLQDDDCEDHGTCT